MARTAGVILIGNEILSGKVVDVNAAYLCREFRGLGVEVRKISVIPDALVVPVLAIKNVFVFPGVPEIFRQKFDAIKERFRERPFLIRTVYFRVGEGTLAEHLNAMLRKFPDLLCGSYPEWSNPEYRVRVTLESKE